MHTNLRASIVVTCAAIMSVACSACQADSTGPNGLSGVWANTAVRSLYRESMTLRQVGDHVTGTGTYALEAGRAGPTTIDGTVSGTTLTLTITRDYGLVETFAGRLTDATHLLGFLDIDGFVQGIGYAKQ